MITILILALLIFAVWSLVAIPAIIISGRLSQHEREQEHHD